MSTAVALTLEGLCTTVPGETAPVTQFKAGQPIELSWESSGTFFKVYAASNSEPIYAGTEPTCTIAAGLAATTTLIVAASLSSDDGARGPGSATELYDAITVTISNPSLTPSSLTTGTLEVTGDAIVAGELDASGAQSTLAATTIAALDIGSSLAMLNPQRINAGSYLPSTDGLVLGTVSSPASTKEKSYVVIQGSSASCLAYATGGVSVAYDSYVAANPSSFLLPVKAKEAFTVGYYWKLDEHNEAPVQYWWFPFGQGGELPAISGEEAGALGVAPPPPGPTPSELTPEPEPMIAELLELLEEVAGEPLGEEAKLRFANAVRDLAVPTRPPPTRSGRDRG